MQIRKEEMKRFLFSYNKIMSIENLNESTNKDLELISKLSKISEYIINIKSQLYFQILAMNMCKQKKLKCHLQLLKNFNRCKSKKHL